MKWNLIEIGALGTAFENTKSLEKCTEDNEIYTIEIYMKFKDKNENIERSQPNFKRRE